jgi:hypothetical protein
MDIIASIAVGMAAGLLDTMVLPGKSSQRLIFICLTCFTRALGGQPVRNTPVHRLHQGEPP